MKTLIRVLVISIFLLSAFNAMGATINVPGDYSTIQSAIDNAPDGSTIIVAPGTYAEFLGCFNLNKTLYIKSSGGAPNTIIHGGGARMLLEILNAPYGRKDVTFDGFTFTQGRGNGNLSPVTIGDGSPSFLNCDFDNNSSPLKGGAVVIFGASANPTFINCNFRNNQSDRFGGAVLVNGNSAQASFKQCLFEDNTNITPNATNLNSGGALQFTEGGGTVLSCIFRRNSSTYTGGAVMVLTTDYSHPADRVTFSDCQFTDNFCLPGSSSPVTEGGAIHIEANVIVDVKKCYFSNNTAMSGGAINNYRAQLSISDSVFDNNRAVGTNQLGYGGAIGANSHNPTSTDLPDATLTVTNTMIRNGLAPVGGGISFGGNTGWNLPDSRRAQITLTNVVIENCRATKANNSYGNGGALNLDFANLTANGVYLLNNTAESYGGGILVNQNTQITLNNSFIIGNSALGLSSGASIHVATDNLAHPTSPTPILNNTIKAYNIGEGDPLPGNLAILKAIPAVAVNGNAWLAYILTPYAGAPSIFPIGGAFLNLIDRGGYAAGTAVDPIISNTTYQLTSNQPTQHVQVNVALTPTNGLAINDFNGDKKSDILWRHAASGQIYFWLMDGTSISSQASPGTVGDLNWQIMGVGDFNGDGKADILWRHAVTGQLYIWLMNGTSISSQASPATVGDLNWQIMGVGDFNGDGKAGILWRHAITGQVYIWLMNGTSISSQASPATLSDLNWQIMGVGDFNGDGKADILWRHAGSGQVYVWSMNGTSISSIGSPGTVGDLNWQIKGIGDFDGDGKADILWRHAATGQLFIWLMNGTSVNSLGSPGNLGDPNWVIKSIGDFDGDGKADILLYNVSSGQVNIWQMDGTSKIFSGPLGIVCDLNWKIK